MRIQLNGEERQVEEGATVTSLVAGMKLGGVRVAVERNFEIVPHDRYEATALADGDRVEVVTFVGGG